MTTLQFYKNNFYGLLQIRKMSKSEVKLLFPWLNNEEEPWKDNVETSKMKISKKNILTADSYESKYGKFYRNSHDKNKNLLKLNAINHT